MMVWKKACWIYPMEFEKVFLMGYPKELPTEFQKALLTGLQKDFLKV